MTEKWLERLWEGLTSNALSTVAALIIFLLALPLIRAGIGKPASPPPLPPPSPAPVLLPPPAPVPIQIESPWLTQHLVEMHLEIEHIKHSLQVLSSKVDGISQLLRRRQQRKPK